MATNKNTEPNIKNLEKYINQEILNIKKSSSKNTCNKCGVNYVSISKDIDNMEVIESKKKKSKKQSNKKYFGLIKTVSFFSFIIFLLLIILLNKKKIMNQLKLLLIKYELSLKLSNIKKYILYRYQSKSKP